MSRKISREVAFRIGYGIEPIRDYEMKDTVLATFGITEKLDNAYIESLMKAVVDNREEIDNIIGSNLRGYTLDRVHSTDLAALRLGVAEIKFLQGEAPVVIDAVVTIAKKYGTEKSAGFVNGVMAAVCKVD